MSGLKKVLYIFKGQFQESLGNGRIWVGYIIGLSVTLLSVYRYIGYTDGRVYQIFEPYLVCMSSIINILLFLIGYFIVLSDAPFINYRSTLALYRTSRGQWFWGISLYIIVHTVLYYLVPLLLSCIYGMSHGYIHNLWSRPMHLLVEAPSQEALEFWKLELPFYGNGIEWINPWESLLHTLLFMVAYSLILAMLLFVFNLIFNRAVGTIVVGAVHVIGYILAFSGFNPLFQKWSLLLNAIFMYRNPVAINIHHSYLYFLLILCLLYFSGPALLKYADFKHSVGEQNE